MKKSELKRIIRPMVKECVQETLLESGLLSNIVAEVAKGLGGQVITEQKAAPTVQKPRVDETRSRIMKEQRQRLLDEIGKDAYNGVDLFEGTRPAAPETSGAQAASPLGNKDPGDPGVDISGIVALGGKNWKALMG
jgi:nitrogen regulatory protein PII